MKIKVTFEIDVNFDSDGIALGADRCVSIPETIENSIDTQAWAENLVEELTDCTGFLVDGLQISGPIVDVSH